MTEKTLKTKNDGGRYSLKGSWLWGVLLFVVLVLIDQLTKVAADVYFNRPSAPKMIAIIPGWINLCISYNPGIAYGIGSDASAGVKIAVIIGTALMMAAFAVLYFKLDKRRTLIRIAIVFVVAGGVGNLIDRVYYQVWDPNVTQGVRDMVDLSRFGFAVCNFADFFITGGAVTLVLALLFFDTDAIFPLTEKYKALAKEAKEKEEVKEQEKAKNKEAAKAAASAENNADNDNG
ncbi:MAG: signal peptidase II [Clostridia bacterium]|nr:signal peptidase II [Clostridia bacterium]